MLLERLTVKIIKERYWDKKTNTGKPIIIVSFQDYCDVSNELEIKFTGNLLIDHDDAGDKIKNWLSIDEDGPYKEDGSNGNIFYHLELEGDDGHGNNYIQIGWNGGNREHTNNYMTMDALDGVDCWIECSERRSYHKKSDIFDATKYYDSNEEEDSD
jgi:hypothetical protein